MCSLKHPNDWSALGLLFKEALNRLPVGCDAFKGLCVKLFPRFEKQLLRDGVGQTCIPVLVSISALKCGNPWILQGGHKGTKVFGICHAQG